MDCEFYEEDPAAAALETGIDFPSELLDDDDSLFEDCILCRQSICEERLKQSPWAAYCRVCDPRYGEQDFCLEFAQAA